MARTISSLISEARGYIQDSVEPYRYTDADLLTYLNDAMTEIYRVRPDLYYDLAITAGGYDGYTVPQYVLANLSDNTELPLNPMVQTAVAYFVAGSAALRDDEHTVDARATALLSLFEQKLRGR